jgi:hypothetical protein
LEVHQSTGAKYSVNIPRVLAILLAFWPERSASSPSQIGRFPILLALTTEVGKCKVAADTPELQRLGLKRMVVFSVEAEPERYISAATNPSGQVLMMTVFYSIRAGGSRREGESVNAQFAPDGTLRFGQRGYFTSGTPATLAEDRRGPLGADDAKLALALGKSVVKHRARPQLQTR